MRCSRPTVSEVGSRAGKGTELDTVHFRQEVETPVDNSRAQAWIMVMTLLVCLGSHLWADCLMHRFEELSVFTNSVLISLGGQSEIPLSGWCQLWDVFLTVLDTQSLRSRCQRGRALIRAVSWAYRPSPVHCVFPGPFHWVCGWRQQTGPHKGTDPIMRIPPPMASAA